MAARTLAVVIVAVVLIYHVLRAMSSQCTGGACDWYISFSLFLPLIAIMLAVVTAALAAYEARARKAWNMVLGIAGVLASIGTILEAMLLSDNHTKALVATAFVLCV